MSEKRLRRIKKKSSGVRDLVTGGLRRVQRAVQHAGKALQF